MIYLVDTNILLRYADRSHLLHPLVRAAVRKLRAQGHKLYTTPQNFMEFWNVATRPLNRNGLGLLPADVNLLLRFLERQFVIIPDSPATYGTWRRLVVAHSVSGVQVHDARLAAIMAANGITHILTFNTSDFIRYATGGIVAVDPNTV